MPKRTTRSDTAPHKKLNALAIRNAQIIEEYIRGISRADLAKKYDLGVTHVSDIINHSHESHELQAAVRNRILDFTGDALGVIEKALAAADAPETLAIALKAATGVLERAIGKVPDRIEAKISPMDQWSDAEWVERAQEAIEYIKAKEEK